jgi:predicted phosphoribosyltransferase
LNSLQKQLAHKLIHSHRQDYIMLSIARNGK